MGFRRAWLRKEKLKTLKAMLWEDGRKSLRLEGYDVYSLEGYEEEGKAWNYAWRGFIGKMGDFKGEKEGNMVVMVEEWLGWPLECLQQLKGGNKVV
ncbi:hypothetical protein Pyn_33682 [Prunus yedoensis var. nudiflora]|uniref:Uncharacterized protein n=1 Tax=Prunus yedoensis var. nudiflora TaxID=2094558 RepID=A0A314XL37_PRUYE|nr:hypothetical protein Pyn_33682 [Prunus yedoensis var. nudiflora]